VYLSTFDCVGTTCRPDKSPERTTHLLAWKVCAVNNKYRSHNEDNDDRKAYKFQDSNLFGGSFVGILVAR